MSISLTCAAVGLGAVGAAAAVGLDAVGAAAAAVGLDAVDVFGFDCIFLGAGGGSGFTSAFIGATVSVSRRFPVTENGRRAERRVGRAGFDRKQNLSGSVDSEFRLRVP